MFELNIFLIAFAISQILLVAVQAQKLAPKSFNYSLLSAYCVGAIAYILISPAYVAGNRGWLIWGLSFVSSFIPLILLLLANRVFSPLFSATLEKMIALVYSFIILAAHIEILPPINVNALGLKVQLSAGAILSILILLTLIKGWKTDLVQSRRNLRLLFSLPILFGWYLLIWLGVHWYTGDIGSILENLAICVLAFAFNLTDWRSNKSILLPLKDKGKIDETDKKLKELIHLMTVQKLYSQSGLSLRDLASKLAINEQKLRLLINQQLGAENFNDFLNGYRVQEAAKILREETTKILDVAFEVGFSSLAPFNKAFKKTFAVTPSQYRNNNC